MQIFFVSLSSGSISKANTQKTGLGFTGLSMRKEGDKVTIFHGGNKPKAVAVGFASEDSAHALRKQLFQS